jgi:hypothetical protein
VQCRPQEEVRRRAYLPRRYQETTAASGALEETEALNIALEVEQETADMAQETVKRKWPEMEKQQAAQSWPACEQYLHEIQERRQKRAAEEEQNRQPLRRSWQSV